MDSDSFQLYVYKQLDAVHQRIANLEETVKRLEMVNENLLAQLDKRFPEPKKA